MKVISLRVSDAAADFVTKRAKKLGLSEADIWRKLIDIGIDNEAEDHSKIDLIFRTAAQSLAISRRLAHHFDEEMTEEAYKDAQVFLEQYKD